MEPRILDNLEHDVRRAVELSFEVHLTIEPRPTHAPESETSPDEASRGLCVSGVSPWYEKRPVEATMVSEAAARSLI